ncbi:MAG: exported protein of unknown function, partial [Candidatus Saccharibacteria bacterium]|nr:exported protein of unknown function [Candidatus Saccharibacteria bacterium]
KNIKQQGFTIVELLIVIVVIGILAAITIVAYNGIQNRGKTAAAQAAANGADKKAEAYNADVSTGYPTGSAILTGAASTTTYQLTGVTFPGSAIAAAPTSPATLNFWRCGTNTSAAATTLLTTTVVTGTQFKYWDYQAGSLATVSAGQTSGTSTGGYNITCYLES